MLTNRKIRKAIKNELEQPPPFDEFCKQAGIEFSAEQKQNKKRRWWIPVVSATAACAIIVCGCIPLMLSKASHDENDGITIFADADVAYKVSEISDIQSNSKIVLFDLYLMQQYSRMYLIYPINNGNLCLAYNIKDIIYKKQIEETLYAYEFDYMARTYKNFEFADVWHYKDLNERYNHNDIVFNYQITDEKAYISFSVSETDYFIALREYEGITEINQESVEKFIEIAF